MSHQSSTHTIDLSKTETPLRSDYKAMLEQMKKLITADDFQMVELDETISYMYIETIANIERIHQEVLQSIDSFRENPSEWKTLFTNGNERTELEKVMNDLLNGHVILAHKKMSGKVITFSVADFKTRAVETPQLEKILFGPKDSYVENIDTNLSLLRRNHKDVNLTISYYTIGERSKTKVAVIYYRDITNPTWIKKIENKIKNIHIDKVISHKELAELLIGRNQTVFPLYELVENPSRTSHFLYTGRVLIFIDGTPFGAMFPMTLLHMFYASEYFTQGNAIAILVRMLRFLAACLALLLPAFYVALVGVNTGVVPTELGALIAGDRASIPYPIIIEIIALFIILDIFLESTAYVPGNIGAALNIVGSLVIGQAAAEANLVSHMSIIIIAITAIGTYLTLHQLSYALRIWKYPIAISAALLGFFGIICCVVVMMGHLCHLSSLGVPYMSPLAPLRPKDLFHQLIPIKDISKRKERSKMWQTQDKYYQTDDGERR